MPNASAHPRAYLSFETVVHEMLGDVAGRSIVDLGCGLGGKTRVLAAHGANVVGVEPNKDVVARAIDASTGMAPQPRFVVAGAEDTGLDAAAFDIALFTMSLHHVLDMAAALHEARRLVGRPGRIAVIEPQAPDPIYPVMRYVDDEGAAYEQAQAAIETMLAKGDVERTGTLYYAEQYRVSTPDEMLDELITVDNGRSLDPANRPAFEAAFAAALEQDHDGAFIPTWLRIDVFSTI